MDTEQTTETPNADPSIIGKLDGDESKRIEDYQRQINALILELGGMDLQKHRLRQRIGEVQAEAQTYTDSIASRFSIEKGQPWQVMPDGSVRLVDKSLLRQP